MPAPITHTSAVIFSRSGRNGGSWLSFSRHREMLCCLPQFIILLVLPNDLGFACVLGGCHPRHAQLLGLRPATPGASNGKRIWPSWADDGWTFSDQGRLASMTGGCSRNASVRAGWGLQIN